jgi:L-ascorbate metabolism protein UlaG (beta-lactamase superfamily)
MMIRKSDGDLRRGDVRMTLVIKWLGHASFQIKTDRKTIYVDPYKGDYSQKADLILVTHSHFDHCDTLKINRAHKTETVIIAPFPLFLSCVNKIGGAVRELKPGEQGIIGDIAVTAVEAYNLKRFKSPGNPWHPKGFGVGYLIATEGKTIYHAGDTDFIPEMKQLGQVDVALLPTGDTYTMDNVDAAKASLAIRPKIVIPMHTQGKDIGDFKQKVEANSNTMVVALKEDEELQV